MSDSFCHELFQNLSFHLEEMRPSYVANCVIHGFSSFTATMLNLVTIYAITKTLSLPKPLKTLLLLSLAVSDLGVGLLVQPFCRGGSRVVQVISRNHSNVSKPAFVNSKGLYCSSRNQLSSLFYCLL